jgi:nucleoside-diphosphate-sugar epimerase
MNVFFFGLGFSSRASANAIRSLVDSEARITGTSRTPEGINALRDQGFSGHLFTGDAPGATLGPDLHQATHVVLSIAPGDDGDPALVHHRADLDAAKDLQWLCYFSTVGVYGNHHGEWIDETAPCVASNERSRRRVLAEADWREYAAERGVPLAILRLAGIYGTGRSTFDKLRWGTARRVVKPGQVFNRIHVEDIGRITALAASALLDGTFNLADDEPAPPQDLVSHAANLSGMAPPPEVAFDAADMTAMQRSFYGDNKRVSNAAIKRALGTNLIYPTYREGLAAVHREENA